jgi:hypothetical protein
VVRGHPRLAVQRPSPVTPRQLNRLEQEAELRFLRRYIQRLAARIAELEAILR